MEMKMVSRRDGEDEEEEAILPGFRFHPTDEELVGFYLRRKVEKRYSSSIEFIKQIDIYKYDPWDLPRGGNLGSDKESYFFCLRGRKYKNSTRPNRVTSSGFWKATGIDKQINTQVEGGKTSLCIGLKKSLVYYRGSSGKGTKTDWMMHEYRLLGDHQRGMTNSKTNPKCTQDMEVWTLCRIFKRTSKYCRKTRKANPWSEMPPIKESPAAGVDSKTCSSDSETWNAENDEHLGLSAEEHVSLINSLKDDDLFWSGNNLTQESPYSGFYGELYGSEDWDELQAVVNTAINPTIFSACRYY